MQASYIVGRVLKMSDSAFADKQFDTPKYFINIDDFEILHATMF